MSRDVVLAFTIPLIVYKTGSLLSSKPSNVKAVDWMPQNDILGHAKTRLFLSHVGHNSMYEAAYHGVSVIGFPMWSDQPENARQITRAGMGLWVDINTVTEQELYESISRVLSEPRYAIQNYEYQAAIKDVLVLDCITLNPLFILSSSDKASK